MADGEIVSRGTEAFEAAVQKASEALENSGRRTARDEIHEALADLSRRPKPDLTGAVQHAMACRWRITNNALKEGLLEKRKRVLDQPDRWGRSLADLVNTLQELTALEVGFVSLCEALDLTTPSGRALAGMLAVFAEFERDILRDRVKAGIDQARKDGKPHGRPSTVGKLAAEMKRLRQEGRSYREIAKRLEVSHVSVIRLLRTNP